MNPHFVRRDACPVCAAPDPEILRILPYDDPVMRDYLDRFYAGVGGVDHAALAGADYVAAGCRACGACFQRDIPDDHLLALLYETWISPERVYAQYESQHDFRHYLHLSRQVEMVIRYFDVKPGALKLLDFGMGWGDWCRFGNAYGCDTYGLEISASRIAHARARGVRVLSEAELDGHVFDMINAEQVFEHLPDPLGALRRLRGLLRPGGLVWLAVPDGGDLRRRLAQWDWKAPKDSPRSMNALAPLEHLNGFTHDALVRMAALAGLRPVAVPRNRGTPAPAAAAPRGWRRWLAGGRTPAAPPDGLPTGTEIYFTTKTAAAGAA